MFHAARCLRRVPILRSFLALAVLFQVSERVSAEEPALESEPHVVVAVPMLSKIPYLNRLFKNVGVATNDADQCERIGIDFGFSAGPGPFLTTLHCDPSAVAACHQCSEQATASKPSKSTDGECDSECCRHTCARSASAHGAGSSDLWSRLVEMAAERSAMESAVEAQAAICEGKVELLEAMVGMAAATAKVEARLELQSERDAMTKQVIELTAKNARLEAHLELAEAKAAMMQQMMKLTFENEQLKEKVAELSRRITPESGGAQISSRPAGGERRR